MLNIDKDNDNNVIFDGDYSELTGSTFLKITDVSKNTGSTYALSYVISFSPQFTEFAIGDIPPTLDSGGTMTDSGFTGFTNMLEPGQYVYEFIAEGRIIENGLCRIIGTVIPTLIYIDDMSSYLIYKN